MPAIIDISCSDGTRSEYWVEKRVLRVGSAAECEVRLRSDAVAPHALTVQYRDGTYVIRNRSNCAVTVGDRSVQPESSAPWENEEPLQIDESTTLTLRIDGDPAPVARREHQQLLDHYQAAREEEIQAAALAPPPEVDETAAAVPAAPSQSARMQVVVGVMCLLTAAMVLVGVVTFIAADALNSGPGEASPTGPALAILGSDEYAKQLPEALRARLQETQQSIQLRDADMARRRLQRLQGELDRARQEGTSLEITPPGGESVDAGDYLQRYINYYRSFLGAADE